jgi:hypothetical protein
MRRRVLWHQRPYLEVCERRELLSAITDIMAANSLAASRRVQNARQPALISASQAASTVSSSQSIAIPQNQGPLLNSDGTINNLAIAPTGTLTKREQRRERFVARYVGTFTQGPGRTSTEASVTFVDGTGSANTMLHSDFQMVFATPKDPSKPIGGVGTIFDRNINTNTVLGFDVAAPSQNVDRAGRPVLVPTVSLDVNISAGVYVEGYSQGVIKIQYLPSAKRTPGVISQGKAIVTIHAQIYAANASFILRNAHIDA